jgi:hypothetical protein
MTEPTIQCPKCASQYPDGAFDCPRCGVVFAKLVGPEVAPVRHPSPSRAGTPLSLRSATACGTLGALIVIALTRAGEDFLEFLPLSWCLAFGVVMLIVTALRLSPDDLSSWRTLCQLLLAISALAVIVGAVFLAPIVLLHFAYFGMPGPTLAVLAFTTSSLALLWRLIQRPFPDPETPHMPRWWPWYLVLFAASFAMSSGA